MPDTPALPGVNVGPLDPDATSSFGQVGREFSARQLIRLHAQMHPPTLTAQLARPLDGERTKALDIGEVRDYLAGQTRDNGDPVVPEDAEVDSAAVHGEPGRNQVLTFTFVTKSGRSGKWFAPYTEDDLPESVQAGNDIVARKRSEDLGRIPYGTGADAEILRRQVGTLTRENQALRSQLETAASGGAEVPSQSSSEADPTAGAGGSADPAAAQGAQLQGVPEPHDASSTAAEDEPVDGYDDMNAAEVSKLVRADDTSNQEVQAILDYERSHANRRTVVAAAEESLGRTG